MHTSIFSCTQSKALILTKEIRKIVESNFLHIHSNRYGSIFVETVQNTKILFRV